MDDLNPSRKDAKSAAWTAALILLYGSALAASVQILTARRNGSVASRINIAAAVMESKKPAVAVVPIFGMITATDGPFSMGPHDRLTKRSKSLLERSDVKAVVLKINSPGGSVGAVQEVYDQVNRLKECKESSYRWGTWPPPRGLLHHLPPRIRSPRQPGDATGSIGLC